MAQAAAQFKPIKAGEHDIDNGQMGFAGGEKLDGRGAISGRGHAKPFLAQVKSSHFGRARVIFDKEEVIRHQVVWPIGLLVDGCMGLF